MSMQVGDTFNFMIMNPVKIQYKPKDIYKI